MLKRQSLTATFVLIAAASPVFAQYNLTTLTSFDGAHGANPRAGLILSGTTLYGTTYGGGTGAGTVFSMPTSVGTPTVLAAFAGGSSGPQPAAGLFLSGTTLYGTTHQGGTNDDGEVFSLPVTGGTPTVLASLDGTHGEDPFAGVVLSGSNLLGTTLAGGSGYTGGFTGNGTVYSVPISSGSPTTLASPITPGFATLIVSGNTLYGTAAGGGLNNDGEVFSEPATGGTLTLVASFDGSDGANPTAGLVLSADGNTLYGTTTGTGISGPGEIFSVPTAGGTPKVLALFSNAGNATPSYVSNLVLSGSTLFGEVYFNGADGDGYVFSEPVTGGTPTILLSFDGDNGSNPYGGLVIDSAGNLYGTTESGGLNSDGTIFELSPVPEPTSASLLAIGALGLLQRRRKHTTV